MWKVEAGACFRTESGWPRGPGAGVCVQGGGQQKPRAVVKTTVLVYGLEMWLQTRGLREPLRGASGLFFCKDHTGWGRLARGCHGRRREAGTDVWAVGPEPGAPGGPRWQQEQPEDAEGPRAEGAGALGQVGPARPPRRRGGKQQVTSVKPTNGAPTPPAPALSDARRPQPVSQVRAGRGTPAMTTKCRWVAGSLERPGSALAV